MDFAASANGEVVVVASARPGVICNGDDRVSWPTTGSEVGAGNDPITTPPGLEILDGLRRAV